MNPLLIPMSNRASRLRFLTFGKAEPVLLYVGTPMDVACGSCAAEASYTLQLGCLASTMANG